MQSELVPVMQSGWRMGLENLLRRELKQWFGTKSWLMQALFWGLILGGLIFMVTGDSEVALEERLATGIAVYSIMGSIFPSIVIIIFSTGAILEEKERGTAAWVLSKPVSRTAFILAKLIGGIISFGVSLLLIPGLIVYAILNFGVGAFSLGSFLIGLGPMMLWYMFIHILCITLGAFFNEAGPVAGVPSISLFFVNAFDLSSIGAYTPWTLSFVTRDLMQGLSVTSITPVISTLVILTLLVILAVWRFSKEEF